MPHELVLRDCQVPPSKPALMRRRVNIYHPGYDDEFVPLLSFSGYDSKEGGLWYDFAHTACAIITNNQFDGWLSTSRDQQSPRCSGELLAPGDYWWHLPSDLTPPYAIITDFRSWRFPRSVPKDWKSQPLRREQAETTCQVTRRYHALNKAHIVPSSETEWFMKNGLGFFYGSKASTMGSTAQSFGIDNENNLILLRSDLHDAWDQRAFTFVPKRTKEGSKIVVHCAEEDIVPDYHNVPLQGFVLREVLLARFAWTLLPRALIPFLAATKDTRMVWTRNDHGELLSQRKTAEECLAIANAPLPRSTSPKKRKQNDDEQQVMTTRRNETRRSYRSFDSGLGSREADEEDSSDDSQSVVDAEELNRGRKRFRAGDACITASRSTSQALAVLRQLRLKIFSEGFKTSFVKNIDEDDTGGTEWDSPTVPLLNATAF